MFFTSISRHLSSRRRDPVSSSEVHVHVHGGYHPDTIRCSAGAPLRIVFRRQETSACSEQVIFPAFGKSVTLPQGQDVPVDLTPTQPGEYQFTCATGMLQGRLVVTPAKPPRPPGPTPTTTMSTPEAPGLERTTRGRR